MSPLRACLGQGRLPGGRLVQPSEEGGRSTAWGVGQAQPEPARACFSFLPIASLWPHCGLAVASDLPATGAAGALREWGSVLNTQPCPGVPAQPRSHVHQRDPRTLSSEMPPLTSCRPPAPFPWGWLLRPCCVAVCQVGAWAWGMPCPDPSTGSPLRLFCPLFVSEPGWRGPGHTPGLFPLLLVAASGTEEAWGLPTLPDPSPDPRRQAQSWQPARMGEVGETKTGVNIWKRAPTAVVCTTFCLSKAVEAAGGRAAFRGR